MFWVVKLHAKIEKIYEITAWFHVCPLKIVDGLYKFNN